MKTKNQTPSPPSLPIHSKPETESTHGRALCFAALPLRRVLCQANLFYRPSLSSEENPGGVIIEIQLMAHLVLVSGIHQPCWERRVISQRENCQEMRRCKQGSGNKINKIKVAHAARFLTPYSFKVRILLLTLTWGRSFSNTEGLNALTVCIW